MTKANENDLTGSALLNFFSLRLLFYVFFDNNNIIALKMICLRVGVSSVLVTDRMRNIQCKIEILINDAEMPFFVVVVVVAHSSLSHSAVYSISTLCFLSLKSTCWLQSKLTAQDRVSRVLSDTLCLTYIVPSVIRLAVLPFMNHIQTFTQKLC